MTGAEALALEVYAARWSANGAPAPAWTA